MRTSEFIVCRECKKVHVSGSHTERHWFDEFVYYDERVTDECSECCGVLEDGYTCVCEVAYGNGSIDVAVLIT